MFIKVSNNFLEIVTNLHLEPEDRCVSFDVGSLSINVPVNELLETEQTCESIQ